MEEITGTRFFEPQGGDISEFEKKDAEIINAIPEEVINKNQAQTFKSNIKSNNKEEKKIGDLDLLNINKVMSSDYVPILLIGVITFAGFMAIYNKDKG